jgi:hypothetical protein
LRSSKDPLYATPLAFDIVTKDELEKAPAAVAKSQATKSKDMNGALKDITKAGMPKQPAYNFGTTHARVYLEVKNYEHPTS